jgi:hypothetical protein
MTLRSLAARGLSFAHLGGMSAKAAKAEDEDEDQDREDGNAKKSKKAKASDDDDDDQGDDGQKSGKAKSKAKSKAEDEDGEEDEDDEGKERADDGDDEDEEMRGKSAVARARRREQARCAAIMGHKAAGRNVVLAANLAFSTRMGRKEAIAVLSATPAASVPGQGRSARNPNLGAGGEVSRNPAAAVAAGWDRSFAKVTGGKRV